MFDLTKHELRLFRKLNTPAKIQDFLNSLPFNFEPNGDTLKSPRQVLRERNAHCFEGAFLAAAILWFHGFDPLLLDIQAARNDYDHVVALFRHHGRWGSISKTNHAVLRYREPVYRSYGELAMSFFHEYFTHDGKKTMKAYSRPFNLKKYGRGWVTTDEELWDIGNVLDDSPHINVASSATVRNYRKADEVEIEAGKILEWE